MNIYWLHVKQILWFLFSVMIGLIEGNEEKYMNYKSTVIDSFYLMSACSIPISYQIKLKVK